jgi:hypothetical protein
MDVGGWSPRTVGAVQRWGRLLAAEAGHDRQLRVMVTGTDADTAVKLRY